MNWDITCAAEGNIITKGKKSKNELGFLFTNYYKAEIFKNIKLENRLTLYSDYINNFGNVDVDWRLDFDFKVNQFVRASFGSHIRYDDDIKTKKPSEIEGEFDEAGAKLQWKQMLGVGVAVDF